MISFPSFLQIDAKDYNRVKEKVKVVDRDLVRMVKLSKYGLEKTCMTEANSHNYTFADSLRQFTENCELG